MTCLSVRSSCGRSTLSSSSPLNYLTIGTQAFVAALVQNNPIPSLDHKIKQEYPCWLHDELRWRGLRPLLIRFSEDNERFGGKVKQEKGKFSEDTLSILSLLKACTKQKDLDHGCRIHADIAESGLLEKNLYVGSTLVNMYAKCGALEKAQEVFDELPVQDLVLWTALITGYSQQGNGKEAINCFEHMKHMGFSPDAFTCSCILKACSNIGNSGKGYEIHVEIIKQGLLECNIVVANALVDMYGKCGENAKAQEVFDGLPSRNVVSWNALIAGLSEHGLAEEVINCFESMQNEGIFPDEVTFTCFLKACGSIGAVCKGLEMHTEIIKEGFIEKNVNVGNALVDMYAKLGALSHAEEVFEELLVRDLVSWNALIAGYALHGYGIDALNCLHQLQLGGFSPDATTFVCVLKACGSIGASHKGQEIHHHLVRRGLGEKNVIIGISLVDMYAKCGKLAEAQEVFNELPNQNIAAWNALIAGYVQHGHGEEAISCYEEMQMDGLFADEYTLSCILKACGSTGAAHKGSELHSKIVRDGFLKDGVVCTALVDMYAKLGELEKAQKVFDELSRPDVVAWNALIAGYAQHEDGEKAIDCFDKLHVEGLSPDDVTLVCVLKACGSVGAAEKGQELHAKITREGLLRESYFLGTALVDMYAKCGTLPKAQKLFDELPVRDVVTWNSLISGYAQCGRYKVAFSSLEKMIEEGIEPNWVSYTILLGVCSHSGLLEEGQNYFEAMCTNCNAVPMLEHHSCMVDLFGRAGDLYKAMMVIKQMPFQGNLTLWHMVLGTCMKWRHVQLGHLVFQHAINVEEKAAVSYICMSNIFAAAGMECEES